jgi:hypothetical protein
MHFLAIVSLAILAAVAYGILHDQVTARVCIEYFTIGHPQVTRVPLESPTTVALLWGIIATWWVGLGLGIPLAICARVGRRPKISARQLAVPLAVLMLIAGIMAILAGTAGWTLASRGSISLPEPLASKIPAEKHVPFLADLFAHNASYCTGFVGGLVLCWWTWRRRARVGAVGAE